MQLPDFLNHLKMYALPIYENHIRLTMKFHYAQKDWKRPEEKTSSKKDNPFLECPSQ